MINKYQSILRMKNSILATLTAGIIFILLFTVSCNKKDISIINSSDNATKEMILSYLNEQKIVDLNASLFIDTLISKSDWSDLSETSISKDVKLIYVPLNYSRNRIGMTFLYNNNTQSIYYSLITETPLSYSSISPTKNTILNKPSGIILSKDAIRPIDVIASFYKYNMNGYTGSIKAFSLSNSFLWEYGYQNGNRKYERLITNSNIEFESNKTSPKQSYSVGSNKVKLSGCVWSYLVTYYNDGSQDWDLIGLKCNDGNDCQTTIGISEGSDIIKADCSGNGNGPGGGSGNGDFDKIINDITDPCLKALITKLQNANKLTNAIGGILQNVFGRNDNITLTFIQDDNLKLGNVPLNGQATADLNNLNKFLVTLNNDELKKYSNERQTITIMHEILHNYFYYKYKTENTTPNHHTKMLKEYTDKMSSTLMDLYPIMKSNPDVAVALCFDGLKTSRGYLEGNIDPNVFDSVINNYNYLGLDINNWKIIANKGKYSDSKTSPISTITPCSNSSDNN